MIVMSTIVARYLEIHSHYNENHIYVMNSR